VHGGIGPELHHISQIDAIARPITDISNMPMVVSMLWADPTLDTPRFHASLRSQTQEYGPVALHLFLEANKLNLMLRGHQVVNGVQKFSGMSVITVFSSSSNDMAHPNKAALIQLLPKEALQAIFFDPLPRFNRTEAAFFDVCESTPSSLPRPTLARGSTKFAVTRSASLGILAAGILRSSSFKKKPAERILRPIPRPRTFTSGTDDAGETLSPISED
jgi:hypothetical protein